jgi:purine-binding chemotaxis protein CheW
MDMITEATVVARHEAVRQGGAAATPAGRTKAESGEFLTFRLGAEEYGIDILRVQEIRSYEPPTRIANAPSFIKGVVNLRGVIVPIIDLRLKLNCDTAEYNDFTVVIVLNVRGRVVGAVVDSVSDVLELSHEQIKPAPELSSSVDSRLHHRHRQREERRRRTHADPDGHRRPDEQRRHGPVALTALPAIATRQDHPRPDR